ncbi:bacteriohemerythrin [mine drainage metagenome]|uniref:Bacteriohemerythrin n=1 Tax=mine drainage metagenome TaxID=410659 RepID=A0A1J5RDJ2_9ZZZZ
MSIEWRNVMSVGDPTVDGDHKHLIDLINAFETSISGEIDHRKIARVLLGLVQYTGEHFAREEELQLKVRYPYYESHRKQHRDVLRQLQHVLTEYTEAHGVVQDSMIREISRFLKDWLVGHIIESDLRMKPYIEKMRAEQAAFRRGRRPSPPPLGLKPPQSL